MALGTGSSMAAPALPCPGQGVYILGLAPDTPFRYRCLHPTSTLSRAFITAATLILPP